MTTPIKPIRKLLAVMDILECMMGSSIPGVDVDLSACRAEYADLLAAKQTLDAATAEENDEPEVVQ